MIQIYKESIINQLEFTLALKLLCILK